MAFSAVTERGSGVEKLLDSSFTGSPSAALTVGKIVFVLVATDNRATVAGATTNHSTLTDTDGHTWVKVYERTSTAGAANDGVNHSLWWAKVTTEIGTGDVFTLTLDGDATSKVMGFWEATVGAGNTIQLAGSTFLEELATTNPTSIALSGLASKEYLFLGIISREEENVAWTEAASHTNVFAAEGVTSSTVGVSTTNIVINVGYRILTGTGDTFDVGTIAGASQEIAQALLAFEEVSDGVTGTVAVTQANQTSTASGVVANPVTGTVAVTQADQTSTASGSVISGITGTAAVTQADQTSTASGLETIIGTAAVTQANQTSTAAGVVANPVTGTAAVTQADQTSTASGTVASNDVTGTAAITQANQTSSAIGLLVIVGSGVTVQASQIMTGAGLVDNPATTFWTPDPVAFVRIGPGDDPPWN